MIGSLRNALSLLSEKRIGGVQLLACQLWFVTISQHSILGIGEGVSALPGAPEPGCVSFLAADGRDEYMGSEPKVQDQGRPLGEKLQSCALYGACNG